MPKYEIEVDGSRYEVEAPDDSAISGVIDQIRAGSKAAPTSSEGDWSFDNAVRSMGRGVLGLGSYLDEANAATNATLAPLVDPMLPDSFEKLPGDSWGERYDQALGIQRRKDSQFDEAHPYASTGLKIAGGIGSGGALLKAAPSIGSYVLGNTGATIPARMIATTFAGGGTGAVQGFGAGENGAFERTKQAGKEALIGGGTSLAMMPVAAGVSAGMKKVADALIGRSDDALSTISREGRDYVTRELADPELTGWYRTELDRLGPEAMLADVSPEWLGVARGAAARPGTRSMVIDPLDERSALANSRLRADVVESLGPDPVPSQIDREIQGNLGQVARRYGPAFEERSPYDFAPIAEDLDNSISSLRGDAQRVLQRVRGMLNEHGEDALSNDPSVAFQTRQAIDGMLTTEVDPKVVSALTEARQMIDDALTQSVPRIKEIDSAYAELSRQREALTQGRPILNNEATAMRPSELDRLLNEGALPQGMQIGPSAVPTRMQQGALGEVYRAIGTKANDTTALRNIVRGEGDWNRDKLGMLFGQENADAALGAIDRETIFGDTANRVTRGSDTAMANRFSKFLDEVSQSGDVPNDTTAVGLGVRALRSVARALMQRNSDTNASKVAEDIGKLSVAQGGSRDAIVDALLRRGQENVISQQRRAVLNAILQSSGRSGYPSLPGARN